MQRFPLSLAAVTLTELAACGDGTDVQRYIIDPPTSTQLSGDQLGAAELKEVSLPDYAASDEIAWQTETGEILQSSKILWADQPVRAFTVTLARAVSEISGSSVIPEPWPLASPPQNRIDVRVEKALAANDGYFRLEGRYFVSAEGGAGSHHTRAFDIAVPIEDDTPGSIADAASVAITLLAEQIATLGGPGTTIVATTPGTGGDPFADLPPLF